MKTQISIRIENEVLEQLAVVAERENRNRSNLIETAVKNYLAEKGAKEMKEKQLKENMIKNYAEVCANAYVGQFLLDDPVMNEPVIIFDTETKKFSFQSSLSPVQNGDIVVDTIEEGMYGETSDDVDQAKEEIITCILEYMDKSELWEKISNSQ